MDEKHLMKEVVLNAKLKDLNPMFFGYILQKKGFSRSQIKNFTFIHYIEEGSGFFEIRNQKYNISPGDMFIMPNGIPCRYYVEEDWKAKYVAFDGELSHDFSTLPPVLKTSGEIFDEIIAAASYEGRKDILVSSILMRWYLELFPKKEPVTNDIIMRTKEYIDENYMNHIKVEDIAKMLNINRSYLSRIFKEKIGMTIREYLISVRLKEAKHLLNDGKNVTEAAFICGFSGQSHFSKTFKKYYACAPKAQKNVNSDI